MRHLKKAKMPGTDASHAKSVERNLAIALFENERIKTTETKAKAVRSLVDKCITWAKEGDVHSRRMIIRALGGDPQVMTSGGDRVEVSHKLIDTIAPRFEDRQGG
ncbi:MAG: 50S ribosomal protein L17, partial [Coriobacteriales bacterium]|nr:50S ribosomal protein L17 [Coriobacteriales bacterium]